MSVELKWKRVYEIRSRAISHYVATADNYNLKLRIWPLGGYVTIRRFNLVISHRQGGHILAMTFYKLGDAKAWADDFFGPEGATIKAIQVIPLYGRG